MKLELEQAGSNQTIVTIGDVEVFFSYAAAIDFRAPGAKAFNPRYRGYSVTTSKHAGQMGVNDYPDSPDFADRLAEALATQGRGS